MGLDIKVYSSLEKVVVGESTCSKCGHTGPDLEDTVLFSESEFFPERADNIEFNSDYMYSGGWGYRVGGYGWFDTFREILAKISGYELVKYKHDIGMCIVVRESHQAGAWKVQGGPFHELINFSDHSGIIGPKTSYKLLMDFHNYEHLFRDQSERFRDAYEDWTEVFEDASKNGCVEFT